MEVYFSNVISKYTAYVELSLPPCFNLPVQSKFLALSLSYLFILVDKLVASSQSHLKNFALKYSLRSKNVGHFEIFRCMNLEKNILE